MFMRQDEIIASLKRLIKKELLEHTYLAGKNYARHANNEANHLNSIRMNIGTFLSSEDMRIFLLQAF
jgi:hypothetical protein